MSSFPRNPTGKIMKPKLKKMFRDKPKPEG